MLLVLPRPSSTQKMFSCCPGVAHLPDLSPIEYIWTVVAEQLFRHHTPVTTVDELWHCVEAAMTSVLTMQSLFHSMLWCINAVLTDRGGCYGN
ncbi:hypothetical protein TNCV_4168241 [Trichonephila clavipes]|nr:hypothetical protein TNCV_4168241 [Trichonephila clavipes]